MAKGRMQPTPLISYDRVHKTLAGPAVAVAAVDDVSLDIAEGEFLAIVGSSGSGKS
ncbi:ATP-binding cassette domain-containing protein, partial [Bradyrhizobium sp.]|uniref:ATP-binding cassette domain-containing protein n=1 Tax=Bradyrhizobium sp. TaxID=376 RepID=UPI00391929F1